MHCLGSACRLCIRAALFARDAIMNPHYSILPLNATVTPQSCTRYTLLDMSPAREKKQHLLCRPLHRLPFSVIPVKEAPSPRLSVTMHVSRIFFFLIIILQMLVAASLLDCYINLKQFCFCFFFFFFNKVAPRFLRIIFFSDTTLYYTHTHTHTRL